MQAQTKPAIKAEEDVKDPIVKTPYEKAVVSCIALMAVIALFIPADILQTSPRAVAFTDFMATWVPQIDLITGLGIRPELNRFYYSVLWAISPVLLVLCFLMCWDGRQRTYPFWSLPLHKAILLALVGGLILYAANKGFWMTATRSGPLHFVLGNRIAMASMGNITYVVFPVLNAGGMLALALGWLSGAIPRHIRRKETGGGE